jgi:arylsulfatase A-like enzyme
LNVDFVPTVLDICGLSPPAGAQIDGLSLLPHLTGKADSARDDLYFEYGFSRAVRFGSWKYIAVRYTQDHYERMKAGDLTEAPNLNDLRLQD